MTTNRNYLLIALVALGGLTLAGATSWTKNQEKQKSSNLSTPAPSWIVDSRPLPLEVKLGTSFAPVVKQVIPSVVRIDTITKAKRMASPGPRVPLLNPFFGEDGMPGTPYQSPRQRGTGSGVIVTSDGYILTNNHVIDGTDEVNVGLQDGRVLQARVVGKDPKTDVAVIKVSAGDLPFLEMADSDLIEVGDLVLAIGNPFGIGQTVTMGMVSAKDRATLGLDYEDFIQTDAAINPGNSGGALVDASGRLVGINTAILSRSGGNQGIGFAIPTNLARDVMTSLIKDGRVVRSYLGVLIQDLTPALAGEFNASNVNGALIGQVVPRSPAEKAGLRSGDVVLEFKGQPVKDSRQLKLAVGHSTPGETVSVKVLREGSPMQFKVALRELPDESPSADYRSRGNDTHDTLNGVTVAELNRQVRREWRLPDELQGAAVTEVDPDSAAFEAGLRPGDIILEYNRKAVRSADDLVSMVEKDSAGRSLLKIWSRGGHRFVVVDERKAS